MLQTSFMLEGLSYEIHLSGPWY